MSRLSTVASCVLFLIGCSLFRLPLHEVPDEMVAPDAMGVVVEHQRDRDGQHVQLADGTAIDMPNGAHQLMGSAEEGDLLIYGESPIPGKADGSWYASMSALPTGCYSLPYNGEVRGGRLATSLGFSLPLSPAWDETETVFVEAPPVGFCLDEQGRVVSPYAEFEG